MSGVRRYASGENSALILMFDHFRKIGIGYVFHGLRAVRVFCDPKSTVFVICLSACLYVCMSCMYFIDVFHVCVCVWHSLCEVYACMHTCLHVRMLACVVQVCMEVSLTVCMHACMCMCSYM